MSDSRYLLTGSTGFLGRSLLAHLPPATVRLSRQPGSDIRCDLSQSVPELPAVDTVIHNAGKAHVVPRSPAEAQAFFDVNYQGTLHLLRALEGHPPQRFVFISTVAVYGLGEGKDITEQTERLGHTPYARSKIQAEEAVQSWCAKRHIPHLILRLPLVVGQNPPGNLGAIWRMICSGRYVRIQGNTARKSMVLARDVAKLIANWDGSSQGIYHLTDGEHPRFCDLEEALARACEQKLRWCVPLSVIQAVARGGDRLRQWSVPFPLTSVRLQKMTQTLTFSDARARRDLGWQPESVLSYLSTKCL